MSNKNNLVFIMTGGEVCPHSGPKKWYSPIKLTNCEYEIDFDINTTCVTWSNPHEIGYDIGLNNVIKYVIYKDGVYGYFYRGEELWLGNEASIGLEKILKKLAFDYVISK